MKKALVAAMTAAALLCSATAGATTENNHTLAQVGVQLGNAYLVFSDGGACSIYYIDDLSQGWTRGLLAIALSANGADKKINRVDYHRNNDGSCHVDLLAL